MSLICIWFFNCFIMKHLHLSDAFIQIDLHCLGYTFFVSICVPWELNPQPFALLTQCSTTETREHNRKYDFIYVMFGSCIEAYCSEEETSVVCQQCWCSCCRMRETAAGGGWGRNGVDHGNAAGSSICLRRGAAPSQLFSRGNTNAIGAKSVAYNRRPNTNTNLSTPILI